MKLPVEASPFQTGGPNDDADQTVPSTANETKTVSSAAVAPVLKSLQIKRLSSLVRSWSQSIRSKP